MEEVKNCRTCKHSIFDRIFGEYSCVKSQLKVFPAKKMDNCPNWEKRKGKTRFSKKEY